MANTTQQQGDFSRTSLSMANQLRVLKAYIQAVGTQLGVGLVSAIRHVVVWLNEMMKYVLKAAQAFATFMQTIFGKYKGGASGIAMEGLGDAADYADDLGSAADGAASGLGSAADSAKQLKKDLSALPFDELNQLNKDREETASGTGSGGTGGGKGAGGGVVDGLLDWGDLLENSEAGKLPDAISEWGKRIRKAFDEQDWVGLGNEIAKGLNDGLEKVYKVLDPNNVRKKVFPFIDAFTTTFNSFINSFDFNLLGRTIGRGIDDIVLILNRSIERIDWRNLGKQLALGAAGMLEEINFTELGNLLGNKFMILWNTLNGFVHNFPWGQLGIDIADFFNGVFEKVNFTTIADTLATGLNGVFTSLGTFTENFNWDDLVDNIAGGISTFISEFDWKGNGEKLGDFLSHLCDALIDVIDTVNWEELGQGIADFLQQLPWGKILKTAATAIITALGGLLEGMGSTPAGMLATAVINGIIAFKIGSKLIPFVNNIGKAVSGEESFSIVKLALQKLFKKSAAEAVASEAVTTASKTAGTTIASNVAKGVTAFGGVAAQLGLVGAGFAAAYFGITKWEEHIGKSIETSEGLNGVLTEMGDVINRTTWGLQNSGVITEDQNRKLIELQDTSENMGLSSEQMADKYVQALSDMGVSSDDLKGVLDGMTGSAFGSKDSFWELKRAAEETDTGIQTASSGIGLSVGGLSSKVKDYVSKASSDLAINRDDFQMTKQAASTLEAESGASFQKSSDHVSSWQRKVSEQMGVADGAIGKYKASAQGNLNANKNDFSSLSVSSIASMVKMGVQSASMMQIIDKTAIAVKLSNMLMKNSFSSAFNSMIQSVATFTKNFETSMSGLERITSTAMSRVRLVLQSNNLEMWRLGQGVGDNIKNGVAFGMNGLERSIQDAMFAITFTLQSMGLEMFRAGQNLGQSLANGFSSIHIPMPHMYVAWWQQVNFGNGGYMFYPEFGLQWYRKGGLFQGGNGQMIGIAEDNRDEAVLPLEDRRAMARIGSAIADAGGTGSGMSDDMMDKLASRIAEVILATQDNREQPMNYVELKVEEEVLARAVTRGQQRLDYRNNPTPQMA